MPRVNFFALLLIFFLSAFVSANYLNYCNNFELKTSKLSGKRFFLKADCLGMYGNTTAAQCSYLDLNQCFALGDDRNYRPQRMGGGIAEYRRSWCRFTYVNDDYKYAGKVTGMACNRFGNEPDGLYEADFRRLYLSITASPDVPESHLKKKEKKESYMSDTNL
ncbi:hypothetical protein PG993_007865 [Apiospora rasikravindrae]|uniref:Cyanovirin-N domain-containing protein n=1 Tax=Apiospora rasikravindrae TaxID=990691 RepID=A0ABR1T0J4_9PEZI